MKKMLTRFLLIAVAGLPLFAQVKETVNVQLVEVPVTVVDRDGNAVRGLTAANFQLLDDGRAQNVTSFDKIDFASDESVKAISPLNPAARRNFMLLFDLTYSSPTALQRAKEAARAFMSGSAKPRDLVAIATIDADKGFRLITAFTTDRELLAGAIDNPSTFRGTDPLQIAGAIPFDLSQQNLTGGPKGQGGMVGAQLEETNRAVSRNNDQFNRTRVEKQVDALGNLAKTLRAVPGRKQVVLLSEGFDAKLVQGRAAGSTDETRKENDMVLNGQGYNVDSDARYGSTTSVRILDDMARYFRGSDVVLHAVDIQGVRVNGDLQSGARNDLSSGNTKVNSNEALFLVSRPTGGEVFRNSNSIKDDFNRMLKQQEVVYVLGFQSPALKAGKFHDLKVKLVNVPGGARVFHRAGYYEAGGESVAERTLSNAEIILNDIPQNAVNVASLAAAFPTSGANAQVPVVLEINGNDLLRGTKGNAAAVELFIYAFDEGGIVRDRLYQKMTLDLNKVGDKLRGSGVKYYGTLSLPPGMYAVKSLVRNVDTDAKGFARNDVVVPRASDVAVSQPIFVEEGGSWLMVKGGSHDQTNAAYPFEIGGEIFIPSAAVRVKSGQPRKFTVFVYNATPDELSWSTTPKSKDLGQVKSGANTKIVMELDNAQPGASTLGIQVKKKAAAEAMTSATPIAVQ
jgi:VWFA-related protein